MRSTQSKNTDGPQEWTKSGTEAFNVLFIGSKIERYPCTASKQNLRTAEWGRLESQMLTLSRWPLPGCEYKRGASNEGFEVQDAYGDQSMKCLPNDDQQRKEVEDAVFSARRSYTPRFVVL